MLLRCVYFFFEQADKTYFEWLWRKQNTFFFLNLINDMQGSSIMW